MPTAITILLVLLIALLLVGGLGAARRISARRAHGKLKGGDAPPPPGV